MSKIEENPNWVVIKGKRTYSLVQRGVGWACMVQAGEGPWLPSALLEEPCVNKPNQAESMIPMGVCLGYVQRKSPRVSEYPMQIIGVLSRIKGHLANI